MGNRHDQAPVGRATRKNIILNYCDVTSVKLSLVSNSICSPDRMRARTLKPPTPSNPPPLPFLHLKCVVVLELKSWLRAAEKARRSLNSRKLA